MRVSMPAAFARRRMIRWASCWKRGLDAFHSLWPGSSLPTVYAVVGMGTFLAATTHAPLMSFLIIFEMTLEYQLVPALMLACLTAYHVSRAIRRKSIYQEVLHRGTAIEEESSVAPGQAPV